MGRHSAGDDEDVLPESPPGIAAVDLPRGRHQSEDADSDLAEAEFESESEFESEFEAQAESESEFESEFEAPFEPESAVGQSTLIPRVAHGTHADLKMLRETPALRARCAAAVIVPFLLYTAAMIVIGRVDVYLLWVWIPTVTAGVAVGMFLDVAHKRAP